MQARSRHQEAAPRPVQLVVVANSLPYRQKATGAGVKLERAVSGLVTAVEPVLRQVGGVWIGWGGQTIRASEPQLLEPTSPKTAGYALQDIMLPEEVFDRYYHGFANGALWPLCHHFVERASFNRADWEAYVSVNRYFADAIRPWAGPNGLIWVHDFHLSLVPESVRAALPAARLAFFWHIPFPPYELLATLPWARSILSGILSSDLVAFHTKDYAHNFMRSAERMLGAAIDVERQCIVWRGRTIRVKALPVGVDWAELQAIAARPQVQERARTIRSAVGAPVLLLGVDRLDYTKGLPERMVAMERFFTRYPELADQVALLQVGVPCREGLTAYRELRRQVEAAVGHLNGLHGRNWQMPVRFQARSVSREELVALYLAADVALVTPLRDGLNLVAKEYIASRLDDTGVLVLSPFAGAVHQLGNALVASPYDPDEMAEALLAAVTMPPAEQQHRMLTLRRQVQEQDLRWWWRAIWSELGGLFETDPADIREDLMAAIGAAPR